MFGGRICLTVLKMDVVVGKVCLGVVGEVRTPAAAQKVVQAVVKAAVRAKEQAAKDKEKCRTAEK